MVFVRRIRRPAPHFPCASLMFLILAANLHLTVASSESHSFSHIFPPRNVPSQPLIPRPPVCDMAHVTIMHGSDSELPSAHSDAHEDQQASSNRIALLLHLPPFDLSAVATVEIIIDGKSISPPLPPYNDGAPLIMKASGFRAGALNLTRLFGCVYSHTLRPGAVHLVSVRWSFKNGEAGGACESRANRVVVPWAPTQVLV